jgi:hypothetical protein
LRLSLPYKKQKGAFGYHPHPEVANHKPPASSGLQVPWCLRHCSSHTTHMVASCPQNTTTFASPMLPI